MIIRGKQTVLRAIERRDLAKLLEWSNDPDIAIGLGELHFPASSEHQDRWFDRISADERSVRLAVDDSAGELIGYAGYWDINWRAARAELAVVIGAKAKRGQGLGKDVVRAAAGHAFGQMGWHRLDATILATNEPSLRCFQACGFRIEGTRREHDLRNGTRVDRIMLGLLARELIRG